MHPRVKARATTQKPDHLASVPFSALNVAQKDSCSFNRLSYVNLEGELQITLRTQCFAYILPERCGMGVELNKPDPQHRCVFCGVVSTERVHPGWPWSLPLGSVSLVRSAPSQRNRPRPGPWLRSGPCLTALGRPVQPPPTKDRTATSRSGAPGGTMQTALLLEPLPERIPDLVACLGRAPRRTLQ